MNLRQAARKRCPSCGERRLRNDEFLNVLVTFLLQSAFLPSSLEFNVFSSSVISRLRGTEKESDWHEPDMALYIQENLLQEGPDGFTAAWRTGLGIVPVGFTTYSSNAQERAWRTIKGLLKPGTVVAKCLLWGNFFVCGFPGYLIVFSFAAQDAPKRSCLCYSGCGCCPYFQVAERGL
jgi:hypothetical protein